VKKYIRAYPMIVLLLPLVAAILLWGHFRPEEQSDTEEHTYGFVLTSMPKSTAKCERFEAKVLPKGDVYLYILRDSTRAMPAYGDTVVTYTHIEREGRIARAFTAKYQVLPAHQRPPLQYRLYQRLAAAGLSGDELATVGALTLGYKDDIDPEIRRHFQASGAAHVLAVSGLHTGIIYGVLLWLLTLGGRIKPRYEDRWGRIIIGFFVIGTMWFYAWLTGMTPSVVRAVIMVSIVEIGRMAYRQNVSLNTIAAAAVLILLARPTDLWSVSFQLSFAATAAIVIIAPTFHKIITWTARHSKILTWIVALLIVSLAAQIGTLPITLYNFGQLSTYFLLTNLIVLPLATFLVPCGLITIALGGSMLGIWIGKITYALAWLMNHSVGWIENLPGSTVPGHVNGFMVAIYYGVALFSVLLLAYMAKKQ
jgi:ComEC/Rec2-related protein